ncbi:hypothetical protein [Eggerthella sp. YY7918]|uniref:hypothetical protein n=1 Tax=Eggerthella sp. (strain YY7918) TaxID=502558 RepID=UPI000217176E|nr:hypothetical protein [Eggerthella sp. YY7918]BAK43974.1 ABC-type uncharacterized transport system, ATPase component [Eggerthella sp. YY7918]
MTKWTLGVVLCDLVLAVVINTSAMLLSGAAITFASWYPGTASAFFTNVLLQLIVPVPAIGQAISRPLADSKARFVLSVFVENLIFVTCISFTMAVLQAGDRPVLDVWLQTYVQLMIVGYLTSLVLWMVSNYKTDAAKSAIASK